MAHMAIYGHMAIGPYATNMGKWGIPGKSYKNVFGHFPIEITIENFKWPVMDRLWVYNAENFFVGSTHPVAPYIQKRRL